ncbi:MAG: glutamate--tRNA ligase [Clostridia bacterium]|nr:glutamate--tRNA ligase [Clostridia bacterium]
MTEQEKIAELLFPNLKHTAEEYLKLYPKRNLNDNQVVSRYAPSPTGYMHVGNFFQMFISYNLTRVTDGVFFLRIEDTDSKREKKDATAVIYEILNRFGIKFTEYQTLDGKDVGAYGPYVQSQRADIYKAFAKKLVSEGKAFPCFCKKTEGKEDVLKLREEKFAVDDEKEYDPCRNLSYDEIKSKIEAGLPFAIRLKTRNTGLERVKFYDLIKGEIEAKANAKDVILLKNDGIPPYAFAHAIDDTLMGTTIVVRGEEYISSTPSHIEIFDALGFKQMTYCHNPLICKIGDNGNRRKVSKRYDPEADMRFYFEKGYPTESVLEYLLNIINSGFEKWRMQNPNANWQDFKFGINDITAVAPIFDLIKLNDISKNVISRMTAEQVYDSCLAWAEEYNPEFANYLKNNKCYAIKVFSIDRYSAKPRKDIAYWSEIPQYYAYMFKPYFNNNKIEDFEIDNLTEEYRAKLKLVLNAYKNVYRETDKQTWFEDIKTMAEKLGFATDNKLYKQNLHAYLGNVADVCLVIRLALTGRKNSPDLYEICSIIGADEINDRIDKLVSLI